MEMQGSKLNEAFRQGLKKAELKRPDSTTGTKSQLEVEEANDLRRLEGIGAAADLYQQSKLAGSQK